jgi:UDP-N-acetylmuramyl pentapeptide synthase
MKSSLRHSINILRSPLRRHHLHRALILHQRPFLIPLAGFYRRIFLKKVILTAVAGTFGKTSTTRALKAALFADESPETNWNPESPVALELLRTSPRRRRMVLEIGIDRPGRMGAFGWMMKPNIAIVTSIGTEHHLSFGSLEATRNEKAEIVRALPPSGLAVLNGDSPDVLWMKDQTVARVITFGLRPENQVRATAVRMDWPRGTEMMIHAFGRSQPFSTRLIGLPMVYAVLGATAAALEQGLSLEEIAKRLQSLCPTPARLETVALRNGAWLLRDEFKASIETVEAALDVMKEVPARRRIVILGTVFEPKSDTEKLYRHLGARIARCAEHVIFIGEKDLWDPLAAGAAHGGLGGDTISRVQKAFPDALEALPSPLGPGDVLLLKGQTEQRLERIALALMGEKVHCHVRKCSAAVTLLCRECDLLIQNRQT